ncbi:arylsulfatase [Kitasatospora sp. NBC_01539]|uniref:arylsulfatase n=1 Tax=Kitasatospora sp. NBC_01539 TaxID=2903577 RepID=UPI0038602298
MLGLLHTSPVHVATFDALGAELAPGLRLEHRVAEHVLERARRDGPAAVAGDIGALVDDLVAAGATAVLCTCSTVGAVAEAVAACADRSDAPVPVLRVDRPMAAAAVAAGPAPAEGGPATSGPRIAVVAALSDTVGPTVALIEEEAARSGRSVAVTVTVVDGAWERFEAGDREGYLAAVREAAGRLADADVIVLAQASMAEVAEGWSGAVPLLCSPRPGLLAAAALASAGPSAAVAPSVPVPVAAGA